MGSERIDLLDGGRQIFHCRNRAIKQTVVNGNDHGATISGQPLETKLASITGHVHW